MGGEKGAGAELSNWPSSNVESLQTLSEPRNVEGSDDAIAVASTPAALLGASLQTLCFCSQTPFSVATLC